jgi:hypothetical protein
MAMVAKAEARLWIASLVAEPPVSKIADRRAPTAARSDIPGRIQPFFPLL